MPELDVMLDAQGAWPDLLERAPLLARWRRLGVLPSADTVRIAIVVELPDGQRAFAHHTWAEVYAALKAIEAAYGPPEQVPGSWFVVPGSEPETSNQRPETPQQEDTA